MIQERVDIAEGRSDVQPDAPIGTAELAGRAKPEHTTCCFRRSHVRFGSCAAVPRKRIERVPAALARHTGKLCR
jgi:hypothetical protein